MDIRQTLKLAIAAISEGKPLNGPQSIQAVRALEKEIARLDVSEASLSEVAVAPIPPPISGGGAVAEKVVGTLTVKPIPEMDFAKALSVETPSQKASVLKEVYREVPKKDPRLVAQIKKYMNGLMENGDKLTPGEFQLMISEIFADIKCSKKPTCDFLTETPQICVFMNFSRTQIKLWVNPDGYFEDGVKAYTTKKSTVFSYHPNKTPLLGFPDFVFLM
jgi:hypothetical protein